MIFVYFIFCRSLQNPSVIDQLDIFFSIQGLFGETDKRSCWKLIGSCVYEGKLSYNIQLFAVFKLQNYINYINKQCIEVKSVSNHTSVLQQNSKSV